MESFEETSFDDVQILIKRSNTKSTIALIKQEPQDDGYENIAQGVGCSSDNQLENTFTASSQAYQDYSSNTCQNPAISSTVKLETDSCEVSDTFNFYNFNEMPTFNFQTIHPNSYNAIPESPFNTLPNSSNPNRKLKKVPNVTTFQKNAQPSTHLMYPDPFGRQTTQQERSMNEGNTNIQKRKRGRPPGQKNKNPSKKTRKNSRGSPEALSSCNQGLENYREDFHKFHPLINPITLGSNGVFDAVGTTPWVKSTRTYKKRMPKPRCVIGTSIKKPRIAFNDNEISEQHTNYDSSRKLSCWDSPYLMSPFPKVPDCQVSNTIQDQNSPETTEKVMPDEICNLSAANQATDISISNDLDQNNHDDNATTSTQETAVTSNASEISSLNPLQPDTLNLFVMTSSDEDEGPPIVYKIKTNSQSNGMYDSNVLEECYIGNSNTTEKSLQISEETFNPENNNVSSNSNELSSSYNIRSSSISPNFQNVSNLIQEEANSQFPENELELPEHFNSNSVPQDVIKVSNGIIYPNNCDWRNFSYLIYTPDNTSFYAFDPKTPIAVHYLNKNLSNVLQQDLYEYKLVQLEIRENYKLGYLNHIQTSNDKRFECDNCTISYEAITTENAKKVIDMSKYSRNYPYDCGQINKVSDNYQNESVESRLVCFYNTSLYQGIFPNENGDACSQKESLNVLEDVQSEPKEALQVPCCRLIGLSNLRVEEIIDCVKNNERLKNLIEKEIESHKSKNPSLKALSTDTNIVIDVENNHSDFNSDEVKIEPFEELPMSANVPGNFIDASLNPANPREDINSLDTSFLDSLPSYSSFQPSNSIYPSQVNSENPWTNNPFKQYNNDTENNQFYSTECQKNLYYSASSEKAILENTKSFIYQNNELLSTRSCRQYSNNPDIDYLNSRSYSNFYENNTLQGHFNYERNPHPQIVSNCSTNNDVQYPFPTTFSSSHQFSASRSYSEFPRTREFNYSSRLITNSTETVPFSNDGDNYIPHAYNAYNQSQTIYRSTSLHRSDLSPDQTNDEPIKYQRENNMDLLKTRDKTVSKLPYATFGRKPKNPAYLFNCGGSIINYCNSFQDSPQPYPLNLSNSFSTNQYSYQSPVCSQNQSNSTTYEQLPIHRNYPMYADEEPVNLHVVSSNSGNTKGPCDYQPPSGYNKLRTLPQSTVIQTTPNLQMPTFNESASHNPVLGATRPSYQNNLDKITNSNSYRENSVLNQRSLLETKETSLEISNADSNFNYIRDTTYEISSLQILQDISTREPNVPANHTDTVKTKKDILTKNDKTLSKTADRTFSSTRSVGIDSKKYLENCYQKEKKPNLETRQKIAKKIGQPETRVNTWFKNRRQSEKRKCNETLHGGKQGGKQPKNVKLSSDSAESHLSRRPEPSMPILPLSTK